MTTGAPSSDLAATARRALTRERLAIVFALGLAAVVLVAWAWRHDFLTYRHDIGETFVAIRQSENLQKTFARYGMLHVETSDDGQTQVYTHNVNLATYLVFAYRLLGMESREVITFAILPVFLLGLLTGYLVVRRISGDPAIAAVFLGLMLLDFANVGAFAFNALRAWHYVGLFGVLLGLHGMVTSPPGPRNRRARLVTAIGAMVSFGCGYDFFVIVGACAVAWLVFTCTWRQFGRSVAWLAACFLVPFTLRQLEVIYWMGLKTWFTDFYVTLAIKVPFASRFLTIPSIEEIDAIYRQAGLMRPPAYPTSTLAGIWGTFEPLAHHALFPHFGVIGTAAAVICALVALVTLGVKRWAGIRRVIELPAAYVIGAAIGLFIFAPFSLHVYLKHNFPLVAGMVHLAEATCLVLAGKLAWQCIKSQRTWGAAVGIGGVALLSLNTIAIQVGNAYASKELDLRWLRRAAEIVESTSSAPGEVVYAVKLPPETGGLLGRDEPAHPVDPALAPWILARALGALVERPLIDLPDLNSPRIVVYAPGDGWTNLDAREPDLRHEDWLLATARRWGLGKRWEEAVTGLTPGIIGHPKVEMHPDDVVFLQIHVPLPSTMRPPRGVPEIEIITADGRSVTVRNIIDDLPQRRPTGSAALTYNAKHGVINAYLRLPPELIPATTSAFELQFRGRIYFGSQSLQTAPVPLVFSPRAPRSSTAVTLPEPTTGQLASAFRHYAVLERSRTGVGYVILDLRIPAP